MKVEELLSELSASERWMKESCWVRAPEYWGLWLYLALQAPIGVHTWHRILLFPNATNLKVSVLLG